jgi:cytochrome c553
MLEKGHKNVKLSDEEMHRLALWLDSNSDFYGTYEKIEEQRRGESIAPILE